MIYKLIKYREDRAIMEKRWSVLTFKVLAVSFCFLGFALESAENRENKNGAAACELPRFWANAEYLFWEIQNPPEPVPLLVSSSAPFTGDVLSQLGTKVILGGKDVDLGWRSGGRFSLGYRSKADCKFSVEGNYFYLPKISTTSGVNSADTQNYFFVPYINAQTGRGASVLVAIPSQYGGPVSLEVSNQMQGAEANGVGNVFCRKQGTVDLLWGFRYLNFQEDLTFSSSAPYLISAPDPFDPDVFQIVDQFDTTNNFYGGQIGAKAEGIYERFFLQGIGKIALGAICGEVDIQGSFITNSFAGSGSAPASQYTGGYFAQPTNIGNHSKTSFSVIPEVAVNLGYKCSDWLRIQAGYTFIYVLNVLRAGNQIDQTINPSQSLAIQYSASPTLVGEARPKVLMSTCGLWTQGVSAGLEFRY